MRTMEEHDELVGANRSKEAPKTRKVRYCLFAKTPFACTALAVLPRLTAAAGAAVL